MIRIGIDVGGTNTDAVVLHGDRVVKAVKSPTSEDVATGVRESLRTVLSGTEVSADDIRAVAIGTTHFTNAVVQGRGLAKTGVLRLGAPATTGVPPLVDWPEYLVSAIGRHVWVCHGGQEFDGRPISDLRPQELHDVAVSIKAAGVQSVAIASVFSPLASDMENKAHGILQELLPDVKFSLSHNIGKIGLLERENATIINASLLPLAEHTIGAFRAALRDVAITAPLYLTQNDGTWMDLDQAQRYPVATFAAGPTNSMRGATFLSGLTDCIVVDIGGTTSDAGAIVGGFPRLANAQVDIAGVRTNFRMPDVVSIGIGGGSLVTQHPERGAVDVGPVSVGYQLRSKAKVFGGDTLTATDVAVAAGLADIGDASLAADVAPEVLQQAQQCIVAKVAALADSMKTSAEPIPLVVVGGGSVLLPDELPGWGPVIKPENFAVANAVGAALAQVGGETDRVFSGAAGSRDELLESASDEARQRAEAAGAEPDTVRIVEIEELPLAYLPGDAMRVRVKAVGDVSMEMTS